MGCCGSKYKHLEEPKPEPEPKFDPGAPSWEMALYRAKDLSDEQVDHWAMRYMLVLHQLFQVFEDIGRKPTSYMIELVCSDAYWATFHDCMGQQSRYAKERERCCDMIRLLVTYRPKTTNVLLHFAVLDLKDIPTIKFVLESSTLKNIDEQLLAEAKFSLNDKRISKLLERWKAKHDNASKST
jgi:hypothetical protein